MIGAIFGAVLIYALPAVYVVMQWRALRDWHGGWRWMALISLVVAIGLAVLAVIRLRDGSNLWPLPVIFGWPICVLWLLGVTGARRSRVRAK
jgi:hypothetical protein